MSKWQSERSIHEMLKDTPPIRESSDSITSGTEAHLPVSKSMTFPPTYETSPANGTVTARPAASRMDSLRSWSLSTYKCTKQIIYEKLGKTSRTVDTELEAQIASLRALARRHRALLGGAAALAAALAAQARAQRQLADVFAELAQRDPDLRQPYLYNSETQRSLTRNGEILLAAINHFVAALHTLTHRAVEDTLLTVQQYEAARVEYDAYRSEAEAAAGVGGAAGGGAELAARLAARRGAYLRLRDDVAVKMRLLHENRVKVMNKQLLLFHNATAAFFSGNGAALEAAVRHFNVRPAPVTAPVTVPVTAPAPAPVPAPPGS